MLADQQVPASWCLLGWAKLTCPCFILSIGTGRNAMSGRFQASPTPISLHSVRSNDRDSLLHSEMYCSNKRMHERWLRNELHALSCDAIHPRWFINACLTWWVSALMAFTGGDDTIELPPTFLGREP